jgi:hypothetical protein
VSSWFDPNLDPCADERPRTSANGTDGRLPNFPDLATFSERGRTCGMGFDSPQARSSMRGDHGASFRMIISGPFLTGSGLRDSPPRRCAGGVSRACETKSLAPDGTLCVGASAGLLRRRPVTKLYRTYVSKESNRLEEVGFMIPRRCTRNMESCRRSVAHAYDSCPSADESS